MTVNCANADATSSKCLTSSFAVVCLSKTQTVSGLAAYIIGGQCCAVLCVVPGQYHFSVCPHLDEVTLRSHDLSCFLQEVSDDAQGSTTQHLGLRIWPLCCVQPSFLQKLPFLSRRLAQRSRVAPKCGRQNMSVSLTQPSVQRCGQRSGDSLLCMCSTEACLATPQGLLGHSSMSKMMKAVVIHEAGGPEVLKVESRPIATPQPGQVLIHVKAFGLNRSEMFTRQASLRILGTVPLSMLLKFHI